MRLIMIAAAISLAGCKSDPCSNESMAGVMAQRFVKQELRDPDSANFTQTTARRDSGNDCVYVVSGRYSAKNGFGGVTPGVFAVEMHKARGENSWRAVDLVVQ